MKKPQVVFLARLYTPHIGGVETHVSEISSRLKKDFDITVITEQDERLEPWEVTVDGVKVLRIPLPNQKTDKAAIWLWIISRLQLFLTADVIHVHDVFFWIFPVLPLLWLARRRVFITFHGYEGDGPSYRQKLSHQLGAWLSRGNICIGGFHEKWYGVKPRIVSFGAVSDSRIRDLREKSKNVKHILFVGRLSDDVGILSYLSALKMLSSREKVVLDVFGDGPQLQAAEEFVSKHHLPVVFHGFVPHEEIRFADYDVAFVSRYLSILECLVAGVPIIAQYNCQMKYDYLSLSPFREWVLIARDEKEIISGWQSVHATNWKSKTKLGKDWAKKQTWEKLVDDYKILWEK